MQFCPTPIMLQIKIYFDKHVGLRDIDVWKFGRTRTLKDDGGSSPIL